MTSGGLTQGRRGFALPLAVVILIALSLLAALGIDAAMGALRAGTAGMVEARANALAETGLTRALAQRLDTATLRLPAGATLFAGSDATADTVTAVAQVVEPRTVRVAVAAVVRRARFRGFAGRYAFAVIEPDSTVSGVAALRPLPSNWWVATP